MVYKPTSHSIRSVAEAFGVPRSTLATKEHCLVNLILESADRGFPLSHEQIEEFANALVKAEFGLGVELE